MSRFDGSRGPPQIGGMTSLKVDNLTFQTTIDDLHRVFDKYGDVGDVYIPREPGNRGRSRGFAFVRYYDRHDAEEAMDEMDGRMLDGRELKVQLARYGRPERPPRYRGGGGGYGGGGGRYGGDRYGGDRYGGGRYGGGGGGGYGRRRQRSYSRSRSRSRSRSPRRRSRSFSRSRSRSRGRNLSRSPRRSRSPSPINRAASRSRSRSR